jgi:hypothetical protein
MTIDGVGPSRAPGHQPNVPGSSAPQAPLQKVKPGIWASPSGTSALTHKSTNSEKRRANAIIKNVLAEIKRGASLQTKLADAFLKASPEVRQAMRENTVYQDIVRKWAIKLVDGALKEPRITIHPGDQSMHALHRVAKDCPPDLAQDLVVAATLVFVNFSRDLVRHNQGNGAIFCFNDKVAVSTPSADEEASKSSPDHAASMPKYEDSTYIEDLYDWIRRAEVPNPKAALAIEQLERLVDKS